MADKKRLIYAEDALVGLQYISMYGDVNDTMIQAAMRLARSKIQNAPTVDAVEVVHSMWTFNMSGSATCQHCHRTTRNAWDHDSWFRYCPDCGAKMDGVDP